MSQQQQQWFYASEGTQLGPVDETELRALVASGAVRPADLVWRDGMADWVPASAVAGLVPGAMRAGPVEPPPQLSSTAAASGAGWTGTPGTAGGATATPYGGSGVLPYAGGGGGDAGAHVTAGTIELLRQTRPWVLLFSVLMFIGTAVIALGAFMTLVGGLAGAGQIGAGAGAPLFVMGLINLAVALLYFFPALHLGRYASRIAALVRSGNARDLEAALAAQRSFWKFLGVLTLVVVGLSLLAVLILVIAGAMLVG